MFIRLATDQSSLLNEITPLVDVDKCWCYKDALELFSGMFIISSFTGVGDHVINFITFKIIVCVAIVSVVIAFVVVLVVAVVLVVSGVLVVAAVVVTVVIVVVAVAFVVAVFVVVAVVIVFAEQSKEYRCTSL